MTNKCFTPLILAVDVGTTSIKAGVISADGRLDVLRQRPTVYHLAQPPAFEVDMDRLAAATVEVLKECVAVTEDASSIVAVAVTALGDGVWPLDRRHRPAAPALIWRDGRSNEVLRRWRREGRLAAVAELTGTYPTTAHQTTQMAWLKAHLPERVASVRHLFFAEDWIGFVLTGQVGVSIANFEHTYGHVSRVYCTCQEVFARFFCIWKICADMQLARGDSSGARLKMCTLLCVMLSSLLRFTIE